MSDIEIKDFTPLYDKEVSARQHDEVKEEIACLITLLNTHRLLTQGGIELYESKKGYEEINDLDELGTELYSHVDLAFFMFKTIAELAEEAYHGGESIIQISQALRQYEPGDKESGDILEKLWKENEDLLRDSIYLYSEYLYKVFLNNPYNKYNQVD